MNEISVATAETPISNIEVTAENSDEMAECQTRLIDWCRNKIQEMESQVVELEKACETAVKNKWSSSTLKRHRNLAFKRVDFYKRMLTALEHGYQIVPTFPVTVFAIRTDRTKPLKMMTSNSWHTFQQDTNVPAGGEGEYQNPFPVIFQRTYREATETQKESKGYWAEAWKDIEFPISMAKHRIMEATNRAMAIKIFDDLGILPTETSAKVDPIIVARLKDPRSTRYNQRWVTFIVAWHLNTNTL